VTFKVESHNHPSYIEPFQGAATGVGGIVRDIISMGARPVAVMDQLRFGDIDAPDTARVVDGVVGGISFYANCLGLPNIGGETYFDSVYQGNPLVNALAVGVLRHEDLHLANARGVGNKVVLFEHVPVATASAVPPSSRPTRSHRVARPSVRRPGRRPLRREGADRVLSRAVPRRARRGHPGPRCGRHQLRHLELASNGDGGMFIELDKVLLRDRRSPPRRS
jgi:phosphoribosylformylglycinamidine synthase